MDLVLVIPSTFGLTPCEELPNFVKKMKKTSKNVKILLQKWEIPS
jgi:hypothetical protein